MKDKHKKRGVLLLVILALLAMFALVAVAFVLLSGQARSAARTVQKIDQYADPPRLVLDQAARKCLVGDNNPASVMKAHSLGEGIYGNNTCTGQIANLTSVCGGQLLEFLGPPVANFGFRTGCVLTMTSGAAAGESTHIVGWRPNPGNANQPFYQIVAFQHGTPANNDAYIINGVPFSGTGFGFDPTATRPRNPDLLDAKTPNNPQPPFQLIPGGLEVALLPNLPLQVYPNFNPPGGANSDYTAPDYQHMLLGAIIPRTDANGGALPPAIIPSLHRPELIQYWNQRSALDPKNADMQALDNKAPGLVRLIMMRPNPVDHPNFTGSNPLFNPTWDGYTANEGAWDVDCDGDGIPDSIWVDLGMPVRSLPDGRLYKPLFAILCLDLDGRLNLNAHGDLAQTDTWFYNPVSMGGTPPFPVIAGAGGPQANTNGQPARGLGYGPAEINLAPLFENDLNLYKQVFAGRTVAGFPPLEGRYGDFLVAQPGGPVAGHRGTDPSLSDFRDWLAANSLLSPPATGAAPRWPLNCAQQYPLDYGNPTVLSAFGSPPDLKGTLAVDLDLCGQPLLPPIVATPGYAWPLLPDASLAENVQRQPQGQALPYAGPALNNPYSIDLTRPAAQGMPTPSTTADNPFSPAELERLLRPFDRDATTLPRRLYDLTAATPGQRSMLVDAPKRYAITTESWDLPSPAPAASKALRDMVTPSGARVQHVVDLLRARQPQMLPDKWPDLLPPELLAGSRLNLNPPLSFSELLSQLSLYAKSGQLWSPANPGVGSALPDGRTVADLAPPGGTALDGVVRARQEHAKHLYVLALLLLQNNNGDVELDPTCFAETTLTPAEKQELTLRRIAQWAINVVDFQTPDSIMTPFKYDTKPFSPSGWGADFDLTQPTKDTRGGTDCRVVWGCKRPELLLTETLAFHNRRVADTAFDRGQSKKRSDKKPGSNPPESADPTLDQPRIPQGSFFAEVYCTNNPNNPAAPADLYSYVGNQWKLDLERLSPPVTDQNRPDRGLQYPVWRMVISESRSKNADNNVFNRVQTHPDSCSLEPQQTLSDVTPEFSLLVSPPPSETPNVKIERIVWLTTLVKPTAQHIDAKCVYYSRGAFYADPRNSVPGLLAGDQYAMIGPRLLTAVGSRKTAQLGDPSLQQISLAPVDVTNVSGADGGVYAVAKIKPTLGVVVAGGNWDVQGGFPAGWSEADHRSAGIGISVSEPVFSDVNYYPEPKERGRDGVMEWYGDWEQQNQSKLFLDKPLDSSAGHPLFDDGLLPTATTQNYKTVFLQRLANPLAPYHWQTNPYRTVDWSPVDLTVFNGEDRQPTPWPPADLPNEGAWDKDDPPGANAQKVTFASRQRGDAAGQRNLWPQVTWFPPGSDDAYAGTDAIFGANLNHSLGFINRPFWANPAGNAPDPNQWTTAVAGVPAQYIGDPVQPFPWLAWPGRPLVSQMELLMVPSSHPARLLWEFNFDHGAAANVYNAPVAQNAIAYPYLLNFFRSGPSDPTSAFPQLYRVLDYVGVPSHFVGTQLQANPALAATTPNHNFHPPFNRIPTLREPGRLNLNTVFCPEVMEGLVANFPEMKDSAFWAKCVRSRRGYDFASDPANIAAIDPNYPTRFANPVRSFAGGDMVPLPNLRPNPDREIEATLLRSDPTDATRPLFASKRLEPYENADRNPFFRYQGLERLGNLVTTRSNVYAVWITVGYFEVQPVAVDPIKYPDGYQLGQELGAETGEVERHRAFYIFDRTIPVGFQRGQDLNVEDAIVLRRFIE